MRRVRHHRFETDASAVDVEAWVNNDAPAESFETVEVRSTNRLTARHEGTAHVPRVHAAAVADAIAAMTAPSPVPVIEPPADPRPEACQVVITNDALLAALDAWLDSRGLKRSRMPSRPDDLPTYVITPKELRP